MSGHTHKRRVLLILLFVVLCVMQNVVCEARSEGHIRFPLRVSQNCRYFEDQGGNALYIHGDSAWSLISQLNLIEIQYYINTRKSQGFNAVLVNLIEAKFSNNPPKNAVGIGPFQKPGDITTPNKEYFAFVDKVINYIEEKNMLILLVPAYLGHNGEDEGWFKVIKRNGAEKLRQYGRYIGNRYKKYQNILWVVGGDYTPLWLNRWTVDALAEGIREGGANQLMTAHCGQESSRRVFGDRKWLNFNTVYSYALDLYRHTYKEYMQRPIKPFIMIESIYEGEHNATPLRIRQQAYWSLLTGAAGHCYGNNPVWNFNSPVKVFETYSEWKSVINSRGANEMKYLWEFIRNEKWNDLVPVKENHILSEGYGKQGTDNYSTAAATTDGRLIVFYLSSVDGDIIRIDCGRDLSCVSAFWYDPTSGDKIFIAAQGVKKGGLQKEFVAPGKNRAGDKDWLLVLRG